MQRQGDWQAKAAAYKEYIELSRKQAVRRGTDISVCRPGADGGHAPGSRHTT